MMKFSIMRSSLMAPLQTVGGVIERKQTIPVLKNILVRVEKKRLLLMATDTDIEIAASIDLHDTCGAITEGAITIPARKLVDICKSLPENALITFKQEGQIIKIHSGTSSGYTLSTLPATGFPNIDTISKQGSFIIKESRLRQLINRISFAMANQDVRYYLNGVFLEIDTDNLRGVTTDAHRLALCDTSDFNPQGLGSPQKILIPRKSILELARLISVSDTDKDIEIIVGEKHLVAKSGVFTYTSKLIDGAFPDYLDVIPKNKNSHAMSIIANRKLLKSALQRASILSNEKNKGIRFFLSENKMKLVATNAEQEEAEEHLPVNYTGDSFNIGFNVVYMLDILSVLTEDHLKVTLRDANSSVLIEGYNEDGNNKDTTINSRYVVMPMIF